MTGGSSNAAVRHEDPAADARSSVAGRHLTLRLLGTFRLSAPQGLLTVPPSSQRLLALLAMHDRPLSRSFVAGTLWEDRSEAQASRCLRSALWRLRRAAPMVHGDCHGTLMLSDELDVDLRRVLRAARHLIGYGSSGSSAPTRAVDPPIEPRELCRELLPDWYDEWVILERERVRQLCVHALEARARSLTAEGRFAEAIECAHAAITMEVLRESSHRELIRAHLAEGNYAEAVAQYQRFRQLLQRELALEPSPLLQRMMDPVGGGSARSAT